MSVKHEKRSGQRELSNLFRKISSFFRRKLVGIMFMAKTIAAQLNGVPSIGEIILAFQSFFLRQVWKLYNWPSEKSETGFFLSVINCWEKIPLPKAWNMTDREPVVMFIQKSDKSDRFVSRKLHLKRSNAEGCNRREKMTAFWRVLVRIGFAWLA